MLVTFLSAIILIINIYKHKKLNVIEIFKSLKKETIFLLIWFFAPLLIIVLFSHLVKSVFSFRNMIIAYAPMLILFSRLIVKSNFHEITKNLFVFLFVSFLLYNLLFIKQYYSKPTKEQFREAVKYVISEYNHDQKADIFALTYHEEYFNYYFRNFNSDIRVNECVEIRNKNDEIEAALSRCYSNHLWLLSGHQLPSAEFLKIINKNYKLVDQKNLIGAQAILYIRKQIL